MYIKKTSLRILGRKARFFCYFLYFCLFFLSILSGKEIGHNKITAAYID